MANYQKTKKNENNFSHYRLNGMLTFALGGHFLA